MPSNISRRTFVASAVTAASAVALPKLASSESSSSRRSASSGSDEQVLDLAIIGAGIAGIYSGWRLLSVDPSSVRILGRRVGAGRRLRVKVFEGSSRVGGRLLSARPVGLSAVCELGGMRFASSQRRVVSLIDGLKLPHHRLYSSHPQNHVLLRGKHLRISDLTNPARLPYQLTATEQDCVRKNGPDVLIQCALTKLLPAVAELHGDELFTYLQAAELDGRPLYQHGLWNLLARTMSSEALALAQASIGFDTFATSNACAVDLIMQYLAHTPDVTYHALDDGYASLPWTLQRKFESAGGEVVHGAWLQELSPLTLSDGTVGIELRFSGSCPAVRARGVILAMPRRSLELVLPRCLRLAPNSSATLTKLLNSVAPVPVLKSLIRYPTAWWKATGVCHGYSLTDLPIRQCWYWTESRHEACETKTDEALIMVFNDAASVTFWGGLRPDDARAVQPSTAACRVQSSPRSGNADDAQLGENWRVHRAPVEMVSELHRQILVLHDVPSAPEPLEAAYADWSDDPFGAGVHWWNPGVQSWRIVDAMTQPIKDVPCYVCGEAYSTVQSWVEGALLSADMMLQQRLNLPGRVM